MTKLLQCLRDELVRRDYAATCPYRIVDWHTQRELNGVDHRLALGRGATGGITPTRRGFVVST